MNVVNAGGRCCSSSGAKLEAVESGITTLEAEFLANIVLPGAGTVAQWLALQVDEAYATGRMPPIMAEGVSANF